VWRRHFIILSQLWSEILRMYLLMHQHFVPLVTFFLFCQLCAENACYCLFKKMCFSW
jgi:hypothetical protein